MTGLTQILHDLSIKPEIYFPALQQLFLNPYIIVAALFVFLIPIGFKKDRSYALGRFLTLCVFTHGTIDLLTYYITGTTASFQQTLILSLPIAFSYFFIGALIRRLFTHKSDTASMQDNSYNTSISHPVVHVHKDWRMFIILSIVFIFLLGVYTVAGQKSDLAELLRFFSLLTELPSGIAMILVYLGTAALIYFLADGGVVARKKARMETSRKADDKKRLRLSRNFRRGDFTRDTSDSGSLWDDDFDTENSYGKTSDTHLDNTTARSKASEHGPHPWGSALDFNTEAEAVFEDVETSETQSIQPQSVESLTTLMEKLYGETVEKIEVNNGFYTIRNNGEQTYTKYFNVYFIKAHPIPFGTTIAADIIVEEDWLERIDGSLKFLGPTDKLRIVDQFSSGENPPKNDSDYSKNIPFDKASISAVETTTDNLRPIIEDMYFKTVSLIEEKKSVAIPHDDGDKYYKKFFHIYFDERNVGTFDFSTDPCAIVEEYWVIKPDGRHVRMDWPRDIKSGQEIQIPNKPGQGRIIEQQTTHSINEYGLGEFMNDVSDAKTSDDFMYIFKKTPLALKIIIGWFLLIIILGIF